MWAEITKQSKGLPSAGAPGNISSKRYPLMTATNKTACSNCRGRGYLREVRDFSYLQALDVLFAIVPFFGYLLLLALAYMVGVLSPKFISDNWICLLLGSMVALYLAVACLLTIWRLIVPGRRRCETCQGAGMLRRQPTPGTERITKQRNAD